MDNPETPIGIRVDGDRAGVIVAVAAVNTSLVDSLFIFSTVAAEALHELALATETVAEEEQGAVAAAVL